MLVKGIKSFFSRSHNSKYVTKDSVLAFRSCMKVALPEINFEIEKIDFNSFRSEDSEIRFKLPFSDIFKEMHFKLHKLKSSVRLFWYLDMFFPLIFFRKKLSLIYYWRFFWKKRRLFAKNGIFFEEMRFLQNYHLGKTLILGKVRFFSCF